MGLPELTFSLKKAAETAAARMSAGVVALILRDEQGQGVYTVRRESDIPTELGTANTAYIRRAMAGYIQTPGAVYLSVIDGEADIADGFKALGAFNYDYLAGPADITAADASALAELVKERRRGRYTGKAVLPGTAANSEGVVNFAASGLKAGSETYTAAQYASRIAGILAGTPADCSATYAPLPELTGVDAMEKPDEAVDAGKLILLDDGRHVKLGRAVTSKTTLTGGEPELLKKIKMVAAVDLIRYYAMTTVEDEYLGKCANSYDNKCVLLSAFADFFATLEARGVLRSGSGGAELDAEAIRAYLLDQEPGAEETERIKALSNTELRKEDTGSVVFLRLYGRVMDAMEDFHITLEAQ